jgi:zinc finger protein ubi-d4
VFVTVGEMRENITKMPLDITWRPEVGKKVEAFFNNKDYKDYLESAVSFNRKLNEERKMRLPYIDSQTGVAQRHYNSERLKRERMPGRKMGQIYTYPQKHWRKKTYQYLKYFMQPKRFDPESEMHTISQVENPSAASSATTNNIPPNEDSNTSGGQDNKGEWPYYDEDGFMDEDDVPEPDSDDEYEDSFSKKRGGGGRGGRKSGGPGSRGGKARGTPGGGNGPGGGNTKRRTHADNIPDSEKPFSCERTPGRSSNKKPASNAPPPEEPKQSISAQQPNRGPDGKIKPSAYCDFCLGDSSLNKKTGLPEEMVSCAECGRSGHPTCLQFTENMIVSVRKYAWQCIECKTCTLCGTSENDDQLLFCDDCDRGYHMYCLVPPIKEAPEGYWSCSLCIEAFHKK